MSYVSIGNGLYARAGSGKRKPICLRESPPKPALWSFATGAGAYNWVRKVEAASCSVIIRRGFRYRRMTITALDGHYEGRWV